MPQTIQLYTWLRKEKRRREEQTYNGKISDFDFKNNNLRGLKGINKYYGKTKNI